MKKLFTLLLFICVCLSLFACQGSSTTTTETTTTTVATTKWPQGAVELDSMVYRPLSDGTYALCDVLPIMANMTNIYIPGEITTPSGKAAVSALDQEALMKCSNAQIVVIGNGFACERLCDSWFKYMPSLSRIYLFCDPMPIEVTLTDESIPYYGFAYYVLPDSYDAFLAQSTSEHILLEKNSNSRNTEAFFKERINAELTELVAYFENNPAFEDGNFVYRKTMDGTLVILGLSELGLVQTYVQIPATVTHKGEELAVTDVDSFAFSESTVLESIIVGEGSNINQFANRFLYGSSVKTLYLYIDVTSFGAAVNPMLVDGVAEGFKVSVFGETRLSEYKNDYSWSFLDNAEYKYYTLNTLTETELLESLK